MKLYLTNVFTSKKLLGSGKIISGLVLPEKGNIISPEKNLFFYRSKQLFRMKKNKYNQSISIEDSSVFVYFPKGKNYVLVNLGSEKYHRYCPMILSRKAVKKVIYPLYLLPIETQISIYG